MKKILASLILITFLGGITLAQSNQATVTQVGTNNTKVDQSGTSGSNHATVNQYGTNFTDVLQSGVGGNIANVNQGAVGSPVNNSYQPTFLGDWQEGAFITQVGSTNIASITETNNNNSGTILQNGTANTGSQVIGSYYSRKSGSTMGVWLSQAGDYNQSGQTTSPSFGSHGISSMTVTQSGNYNAANQNSIGGTNSILEVTQTGNSNISSQYQNQRLGQEHINVLGNSNFTSQYQLYTVWAVSGQNNAAIDVTGSSNSSMQSQIGQLNLSAITVNGNNNNSQLYAVGDNNVSNLIQTGNLNLTNTTQTGNSNIVNLNQSGGGSVGIVQSGNSNRVEGKDPLDLNPATTGNVWSDFSGTSMNVSQLGNSNVAEVTSSGSVTVNQSGSDHAIAQGAGSISISQSSTFNEGFVVNNNGTTVVAQSTGSNNSAWLDKANSTGNADILQDGDNNKVFGLTGTLLSPSWSTFTGPSLNVDQVGSSNLLQLNANGNVTVGQTGNLNSAYVSQQ